MNEVEEIKDRLDIVDIISGYLTLKRAGTNFKANCPFHNEKTPSFMVNPERQIFKCFGCGESGDIYSFIEKMEGLDFYNTLKLLADRAGVKLERDSISFGGREHHADKKTRLFEANEWAKKVYHKILTDHPKAERAREYLKKRGLTEITIKEFEIGYAPKSWDFLIKFLKSKKFTEIEMVDAGLAIKGDRGKCYDRFRGRVVFPINNIMGSTIAFTSRILDDADPNAGAKYINSSESEIYKKGKTIYGLDKAKLKIKEKDLSIFVEGNMDVISCHQAGFTNVVATSGTAITADQIKILARYSSMIAFCFDSDKAGILAMKKAVRLALANDVATKIIALPAPFKDPDETIKSDPKLFEKAIQTAKPSLEYWIDLLIETNPDLDILTKKSIAKEILPVIKNTVSEIEREHYIRYLAKKIDISESSLIDTLSKAKNDTELPAKTAIAEKTKSLSFTTTEKIIGLLWAKEDLIKTFLNKPVNLEPGDNNFLSFCQMLSEKKLGREAIKPEDELALNQLAMSILTEIGSEDQEILEQELLFQIGKLKSEQNEQLRKDFAKKIEEAERKNNKADLKKLLEEFTALIK